MAFKVGAAEAAIAGSIGGYTLRATHDPCEYTARARSTFLASFLDRVDPGHALSEAERSARAEALRSAHFRRLALRSVQARDRRTSRKRKNATAASAVAIQEVRQRAEPTPQPSPAV